MGKDFNYPDRDIYKDNLEVNKIKIYEYTFLFRSSCTISF